MNLNDKNRRNGIKKTGMAALLGMFQCFVLGTTAFAKEIQEIANVKSLFEDNVWIFIAVFGVVVMVGIWKATQKLLPVFIAFIATAVLCALSQNLNVIKNVGDSILNALGWK